MPISKTHDTRPPVCANDLKPLTPFALHPLRGLQDKTPATITVRTEVHTVRLRIARLQVNGLETLQQDDPINPIALIHTVQDNDYTPVRGSDAEYFAAGSESERCIQHLGAAPRRSRNISVILNDITSARQSVNGSGPPARKARLRTGNNPSKS